MSEEITHGTERPLEVGMFLFNGHTTLDFIGPHTAFTFAGMKVHLVSATLEPVFSDCGVAITPTVTFENCPDRLDILFVPGGLVEEAMLDSAAIAFLADRGATASYVTSVCTGSLVLAAAGLLDGYRSATHWATRDHLARLGVEVSTERVCIDRNRFSGGGVTAGIDFGLTVIAHTLGEEAAKFAQLGMEYDPKPPFDAGSPQGAGPEVVARFDEVAAGPDANLRHAVSRVLEQRAAVASRE
ncbi:DJ-1/PfpI family protein [Streptomyces piniterrae]|uniref:DJ-1/PfpI family protein n=1 Tax=Streptomyces piniterrae TaxID=2571125 RepID=A0A4U0NWH5_9ACTN|nr:DJ-1/PfpI family protein [Streptomyces piniterrae]TJZ59156.1 DJ-1/PfpI family protein [Streptomyces piniterrae]